MSVVKRYNPSTSQWEEILVGVQGPQGAQGAQGPQGPQGATSIVVCTSTTRPSSPASGQFIFETDTKRQYFWNGSAWEYWSGGTPLYAARVSGSPTGLAANGWTYLINWGTENYDYNNNMNPTAGTYTVPVTGLYEVSAHGSWAGNNNPQTVGIAIMVNGNFVSLSQNNDAGAAAGAPFRQTISDCINLTVGDTVAIRGYNGGGNFIGVIGSATYDSHFAIRKVND